MGPTCEIHPCDRHNPGTTVFQGVITHVGVVHIPDLNFHVISPNPVPVVRHVLRHTSAVAHLRKQCRYNM